MANTFSGKGGDRRETPTLRKYLAANPAPNPSQHFLVQLIFDSKKFGSYTLVTEKFKIPVYENSPIFDDVKLFCAGVMDNESGLAVSVTDAENLEWDLIEKESEVYHWKSEPWGFLAEHTKKTRSQKTSEGTSASKPPKQKP